MKFKPLHELRHILVRLLLGDVLYKEVGICGHVETYWNDTLKDYCTYHGQCKGLPYSAYSIHEFLALLMESWPAGTGNPQFPIPCSSDSYETDPADAYDLCENKWVGEQHTLRINLLNYLVEKIDELLEEGKQRWH